ncbi:ABC transporter ATP-binding protein [Pedococcus cremeus]|uniref:ABC transporter ATP-binding protein n=1 Tax=Pedococcus cremeus TaxID=587636 RepID=UPI001C4366BC|nr:ATP-binding cassette domain-containing protein [Pedococcus cremeus]
MPVGTAGLRVDRVVHAFGERVALDGVSCAVPPGRLTGLLGPNGAGKTTLMRILLGVLTPDGGEVWLDAQRLQDVHDRRSWGYMPQERGLYPAMTAGAQVVHFGRLHGLSRTEATARAHALLDELELGDRWEERSDRLSGGMQQRLQLATALVHAPGVVVLDEPFAGLDPVAVEQLSAMLRQRAADGCLVLFSSHQLDLVQDLCEDIVMVDHGRTVLAGSVSELRAASGQRRLRLHVESPDRGWLRPFEQPGDGVRVVSDHTDDLRLTVPPDVDPLAVLDAARSSGRVLDFGLELPTLSELFLAAVSAEPVPEEVHR